MKFRPCIDLHDGFVKQIVGATLSESSDQDSALSENFVSGLDASYYAELFRQDNARGGHVIKLGADPRNEAAALRALAAWPGGLQLGGGVNEENCLSYLRAGASHVIVTSYIFRDGRIHWDRLRSLASCCGKKHLVLDLSCRPTASGYHIATDRWQKETDTSVDTENLEKLAEYCDEFLVHAVAQEGLRSGIDEKLVEILASSPIPVTYAGGIAAYEDIQKIGLLGKNNVDYTVGSALDIFGGTLSYKELVRGQR